MGRTGMAAIVRGLLAGALLGGSARTEGQRVDPSVSQVRPQPVELSNGQTKGSFAVSPDTLASAPPVLALSFTRVVNPANTPFEVFVYFSYRPVETAGTAPRSILLGNGSLYPADRPGGFRLRASAAFAKLKAAKATDVRLVLEMRRLRPAEPWSRVEVTVAPPQWLSEGSNTG
jgi:hypothetical protein